jgi:CBS domain-containing protein
MRCRGKNRSAGGLYLESTKAEQLGVLPGEDRPVEQVMDRRIITVPSSVPLNEAIRLMQREKVISLVVVEDARFLGLLTEHDVAAQATQQHGEAATTRTVADVLEGRQAVSCCEDDIIVDALKLLQRHQLSALPVLNQEGHVIGILTLTDIAASLGPDTAPAWLSQVRR